MVKQSSASAFADERFELRRKLGAGAFGEVYEAIDKRHGSRIALKTLMSLDPAALYRFKLEFRALQGVSHPNLVTLYGLYQSGSTWFLTMELVEGKSLLSYLHGTGDERPKQSSEQFDDTIQVAARHSELASDATAVLPSSAGANNGPPSSPSLPGQGPTVAAHVDLPRLCRTTRQLVLGVQALHDAGHLHRDLKPSNVLVQRDGSVRILDFGLVTPQSEGQEHSTKNIAGTPHYMSPEQAAADVLTPASDWYAVGVMLFEALTDRLPFGGSMLEQLSARQQQDGPAPSTRVHGLPPSLDRLCAALLRRDPALRPSARDILDTLDELAPEEDGESIDELLPSDAPTSLFVGREEEIAHLWSAFETSGAGRACVVQVLGPSGVGKTALVGAFLDELSERRSDALVLRSRCYQQESMPYKGIDALVDAIARHLTALPSSDAKALLPVDVQALGLLFPVLKGVPAIASIRTRVLSNIDESTKRARAFEAMRELLRRMCMERPLLLLIDDSQWGDEDSGALLADLLHHPAPPLLLLLTCRNEEGELGPLMQELRRGMGALEDRIDSHELTLEPLDDGAAQQIAAALVSDDDEQGQAMIDTLVSECAGNPFLLRELAIGLREGQVDPSRPISALVEQRRQHLSEPARNLLDLIAVAGAPISDELAIEAARTGEESSASLTSLRAARLIRADAGECRLEIYHDRFQKELLASLDHSRRKELHRRLLEVLELRAPNEVEVLASHALACEDEERSLRYLELAADQAIEALAFNHAAHLYEQLLAIVENESPRALELLVRCASALELAGHLAEAAEKYLAALERCDASQRDELRLEAADCLLKSGHLARGLELIGELLDEAGIDLPPVGAASRRAAIWGHIRFKLRGLGPRRKTPAAIPPKTEHALDLLWAFVQPMTWVEPNASYALTTRYARMALDLGSQPHIARSLAAWVSMACSFEPESPAIERASEIIHDNSASLPGSEAEDLRLFVLRIVGFFQGDFRRSLEACEGATKALLAQQNQSSWGRMLTAILYAGNLQWLGRWRELDEVFELSLRHAEQRGDVFGSVCCAMTYGGFPGIIRDDPAGAETAYEEYHQRWGEFFELFTYTHTWETIGRAYVSLYAQRPLDTIQLIDDRWSTLAQSGSLDALIFAAEILYERAVACVTAHEQCTSDSERRHFAKDARRTLKKLSKKKLALARELAALGQASLAAAEGKEQEAIALLELVGPQLAKRELRTHHAGAQRLKGLLLGGDRGAELIREADAELARQGAANPSAMARMLVPGPLR